MVSASDHALDTTKHISVYAKLVSLNTSLFVQNLSYYDVKRMITVESGSEEDEVIASDEPLAQMLVSSITGLSCEDDHCTIKPIGSLASLFQKGELPRSLKPRLYMAIKLRDGVEIVGCVTTCLFLRDESLGTNIFSNAFCSKNGLPRFDAKWLFIDIVASKAKPSGGLLIVHSILQACRQKMTGVNAIAVSAGGLKLLKGLGFTCHRFKEYGSFRHMCHLRVSDVSFSKIKKHLHFEGNDSLVEDICWRESLSARALSSIVGRC